MTATAAILEGIEEQYVEAVDEYLSHYIAPDNEAQGLLPSTCSTHGPARGVCSAFRNERRDLYLSSDLIREAVAISCGRWEAPPLGMVTFVDADKTRRKRDPGRCFRRAGFEHVGFTKRGLWAFQMLPAAMPEPATALHALEPLPGL